MNKAIKWDSDDNGLVWPSYTNTGQIKRRVAEASQHARTVFEMDNDPRMAQFLTRILFVQTTMLLLRAGLTEVQLHALVSQADAALQMSKRQGFTQ